MVANEPGIRAISMLTFKLPYKYFVSPKKSEKGRRQVLVLDGTQ